MSFWIFCCCSHHHITAIYVCIYVYNVLVSLTLHFLMLNTQTYTRVHFCHSIEKLFFLYFWPRIFFAQWNECGEREELNKCVKIFIFSSTIYNIYTCHYILTYYRHIHLYRSIHVKNFSCTHLKTLLSNTFKRIFVKMPHTRIYMTSAMHATYIHNVWNIHFVIKFFCTQIIYI